MWDRVQADVNELVEAIVSSGFLELPITSQHTLQVFRLPDLHRDSFDRILGVHAMSGRLKLITVDKQLRSYSDLVKIV